MLQSNSASVQSGAAAMQKMSAREQLLALMFGALPGMVAAPSGMAARPAGNVSAWNCTHGDHYCKAADLATSGAALLINFALQILKLGRFGDADKPARMPQAG
jgi:hypothetical protein